MSSRASTPSSRCAAGIITSARTTWTPITRHIRTSRTSAREQASTVSTRGIYANDKIRGYVSAYDANAPELGEHAPRSGGVSSPRVRGSPAGSSGPALIIAASRRPTAGRASIRTSASWTPAVSRRTTSIITSRGGRTNPCCICCRTGTGRARKARKLTCCVLQQLRGGRIVPQRPKPRPENDGTKFASGLEGEIRARHALGQRLQRRQSHRRNKVETTGAPAAVQLTPDRSTINADGEDVSVFTVSVTDAQGRVVPVAANLVHFELSGPGKILGVGNGDPSCHEPDVFSTATDHAHRSR